MLNIESIKKDFPILRRVINGKRLVYLDNAATSQKPQVVIDAITDFYKNHNANIHRGIHTLSEEATKMYEDARIKVARFINARHPEEIIFTKGTTNGINMVAFSWGLANIGENDEIAVTEIEHHSNLVPWQELARFKNAKLTVLPIDEEGFLQKGYKDLFTPSTKLFALSHASNVLGTIQNIKEIVKVAHAKGVKVLVDGAQAAPHMKVDVQSLDCDFYAFSGHKMLGPTGIGVLYVKKEILENTSPYEFGGGMVKEVFYDHATYAEIPGRFEAGTQNIEGAIGFGAALNYLNAVGMDNVREHEKELLKYGIDKLLEVEGLKIYGPKSIEERTGLIAFTVNGIHPHDLASVLDTEGVAIRSGHHCTMPLHQKLDLPATARASFYVYNTVEDIDILVEGIKKAIKILRH